MRLGTTLLIFLLSSTIFASQKVETRIKSSDSSNSTTLIYQYSAPEGKIWSSEVDFTGTRSKVKNASSETEVTREIQWINTFDITPEVFAELGIGGSNTKVNDIHTTNVDLTLGQLLEDWHYFNWNITAGTNNIIQQSGLTKTSKTLTLNQQKMGLQVGIDPVEWLTVSIFANNYEYNKDVDKALLLLQSSIAVQRYGTAFSDQLSSLIEKENGINLGFKLAESWKLNVSGSQTQDAPQPKVKGKSGSIKVYHRFNSQWDGSVSVSSTHYESSAQNPATTYEYVGVGAGFSF